MKYFLIICALSVLQEVEGLLPGRKFRSAFDVQSFIKEKAREKGIMHDYSLEVQKLSFGTRSEAAAYKEGFGRAFDDREESGECLDYLVIDENGTSIQGL